MRLFKILFLLLLGLAPGLAFAQDVFAPASGDISLIVLSQIFGGLLSSGAAASGTLGGSDPMLNAISTFNGAVLTIGGILAAYTILAGTLGTAHDGEMLGKKFSSVWIPIRYSLGTALVLPIVGGGYCLMQLIVMWLVVQGIGLADAAWSSYMAAPNESANVNMPTIQQGQVLLLAENVFAAEVCLAAYNKDIAQNPSFLSGGYNYSMSSDTNAQTQQKEWFFGDQNATFSWSAKKECGSITGNPASVVGTSGTTTTSNTGKLGSLDNLFTSPDITGITTAQNNATDTLIQTMSTLAQKAVANPTDVHANAPTYYAQIVAAALAYTQTVSNAAQSLTSGNTNAYSSMQQSANTQGWFMAGAWFMKIIDINQKITDAMNMIPASSATLKTSSLAFFSDVGTYMAVTREVLSVHYGNDAIPNNNDASNTDASKSASKEETSSGFFAKAGTILAQSVTSINLYQLKDDTRHPIIIINDMGNRLVTACTSMMGLIIALNIAAATPLVGGAIQGAIQTLVSFLQIPVGALWGVGFSASTMIPMIPFLIWLGSLIGWLILVVEAVLAAPLWAVMHLHPNGDDLTGRGGNGYVLVLSLLLRPVLMIFGLITAIVLSAVMGEFINKVFFQVFEISQGGNLNGFSAFFEILFGTVIYCIIMFTFISKMFSIIHIVPDQLMRWIGGGQDGLGGQMAGAFEQSGKSGFATATGAISGLSSQVGSGVGSIAQGYKEGGWNGKGGQAGIQQLQNEKSMSDAKTDRKFGEYTSSGRDVDLSHSQPQSFSEATKQKEERDTYNNALNRVGNFAGIEGVQDFKNRFQTAEENKFSGYNGDKMKAIQGISTSVIAQATRERIAADNKESSTPDSGSTTGTK
jgi:conjugal transfer/type IV secretion protein DotA/TraY